METQFQISKGSSRLFGGVQYLAPPNLPDLQGGGGVTDYINITGTLVLVSEAAIEHFGQETSGPFTVLPRG